MSQNLEKQCVCRDATSSGPREGFLRSKHGIKYVAHIVCDTCDIAWDTPIEDRTGKVSVADIASVLNGFDHRPDPRKQIETSGSGEITSE